MLYRWFWRHYWLVNCQQLWWAETYCVLDHYHGLLCLSHLVFNANLSYFELNTPCSHVANLPSPLTNIL